MSRITPFFTSSSGLPWPPFEPEAWIERTFVHVEGIMSPRDVPVAIIALGRILKFHHVYGRITWSSNQTIVISIHMAPDQEEDVLDLVLGYVYSFFEMSRKATLPVEYLEDDIYVTIHPKLKLPPQFVAEFLIE